MLLLMFLALCTTGAHAQRKGSGNYNYKGAIPETAFRCNGRRPGYYADIEADCQVYHMCDTREKQFSFLCPNNTLYNQKFMVCDHWYNVNCELANGFYHLNSHIGEVPGKGATSLKKSKLVKKSGQESSLTPSIKKPTKFQPFGIPKKVNPAVHHIRFQPVRSSRDFFIPYSGLVLPKKTQPVPTNSPSGFFIPSSGLALPKKTYPAPSNSLNTNKDGQGHASKDNVMHTHNGTHNTGEFYMTMVFPAISRTPVISSLTLNPQCPRCHPAFLRPGQCTPCVWIRK
ncbi:unnamed protein product [Meganyctiphanes norvegica]|uniref:Chitin-binding type-2 domain-containing protein n=1 Tax=Meganyctiphanes norvegica TaxID=48144 RepID=A0AAV2SES1_MEGNR